MGKGGNMKEVLNNIERKQYLKPGDEERQERRALKFVFKDIRRRRALQIISREEFEAENERILIDHLINHIMRPRELMRFEFSPDLAIDISGNFHYGSRYKYEYFNYVSDDGSLKCFVYEFDSVRKPGIKGAGNRQEIIDQIMLFKYGHTYRRNRRQY